MLEQYRKHLLHLLNQGHVTAVFDTLRQDLQPQTSAFDQVFQWVVQWHLAQKNLAQKNISTTVFQEKTSAIQTEMQLFLEELNQEALQVNISFTLDRLLQDFKPDQMGRLDLVNCGQNAAFQQFQHTFYQNQHSKARFFFISSASKHQPKQFIERLVFSLLDPPDQEAPTPILMYERRIGLIGDTAIERVQVNPLPQGPNLDASQIKFKRYLSDRRTFEVGGPLPLQHQLGRQAISEAHYDILVFELQEDAWQGHTTEFFEWLIPFWNTEAQNNAQTLFFCIVPEADAQKVQQLAEQFPETCCHLDQLGAIQAPEFSEWLTSITSQADEVLITSIVEVAMKQLGPDSPQKGFSAAELTPIFETLYIRSLKNLSENQQIHH
jgi:hypothetical protein